VVARHSFITYFRRFSITLLLTLVFLEAGLRIEGKISSFLQERRNLLSLRQKGEYRIMCLGESTTKGQYPPYLEEILNQSNIGIKFSVIDKGVDRTNTTMILSKLESNLDTYHPDMVITMMGINNIEVDVPSEYVSDSKAINFLESFRIYKLAQLLWLHIVTRFKELKSHDASSPKLLRKINLQQAYAEDKDASPSKEPLKSNEATELKPTDDEAYFELGNSYREQGRFSEAESSFKKAIELNPGNDGAYIQLGWVFRDLGKLSEAESSFKKAIELNPGNDGAYIQLGSFYQERGRFSEAESSFKKATELNPTNDEAYGYLGSSYHDLGKWSEAEESYKKALEINPRNVGVYIRRAFSYYEQGRFSEAEKSFKKAIELDPGNEGIYVELGQCYQNQDKFSEAEESFKKAIELDPRNDKAYAALETFYIEMGKMELARKYGNEARDLRLDSYSLITAANYQKLKAILDKRGIVYVCVQYPMRSLELLKKLFQGNDKGVIFVDNEEIFKSAVQREGWEEYFHDLFAGNFGHCTEKGNRLLAQNIAKVILKEVFGK